MQRQNQKRKNGLLWWFFVWRAFVVYFHASYAAMVDCLFFCVGRVFLIIDETLIILLHWNEWCCDIGNYECSCVGKWRMNNAVALENMNAFALENEWSNATYTLLEWQVCLVSVLYDDCTVSIRIHQ
jgi:hypothetical protein